MCGPKKYWCKRPSLVKKKKIKQTDRQTEIPKKKEYTSMLSNNERPKRLGKATKMDVCRLLLLVKKEYLTTFSQEQLKKQQQQKNNQETIINVNK